MKILASMCDQEFDQIEKYIECDQWSNPILGEYVFYNPTERFRLMLTMLDIIHWLDNE